jgi:CheY-like chemotaxis protein
MESGTELANAAADLLGALAWPLVFLVVALTFRDSLRGFLDNLATISFKAGGVEATASRQREIEAAVAVGIATSEKSPSGSSGEVDPAEVASEVSGALLDDRGNRDFQGRRALWVDDYPSNNTLERQALEALGLRFTLAKTTDEALRELVRRDFDLVISDMGRPPDNRAGYTLLDEVQKLGLRVPYIIYAGSRAPEHVEEARQRGAFGCTNLPHELISLVARALQNGGRRN